MSKYTGLEQAVQTGIEVRSFGIPVEFIVLTRVFTVDFVVLHLQVHCGSR